MATIRFEERDDIESINKLTIAAFEASEFGHHGEAALIDELRKNNAGVFSLVAVDRDIVLGHLMASTAKIRNRDRNIAEGIALGPMSVLPNRQRTGIGSQLVDELLRQANLADCKYVIVFGHAEYYPKFGFERASVLNIKHAFEGLPQELLFINVLDETCSSIIEGGTALYNEAFGPQVEQ